MKSTFLSEAALDEHKLSCAFARAEALAQGEVAGLETRGQARAFLMEIYGVLEGLAMGLGEGHPALWHPRLLQAGLHLLQGELDLNTGQLASAENELKMASQTLANLDGVSTTSPTVVVVAA